MQYLRLSHRFTLNQRKSSIICQSVTALSLLELINLRVVQGLHIIIKALTNKNSRGEIINVDSSLIAEEPKILAHADEMKKNISQALGLDVVKIGIKATTNERMGFVGKGEGMAAMAIASVEI